MEQPSRMRLLLLSTDLEIGGAEKALVELAVRLPREEFDVSVACLKGRGELGRRLQDHGVPVEYLAMRGRWDVTALLRLGELVRSRGVQVVHSFLYHANVASALLRLKPAVVRIWSLRVVEQGWWRRAVLRRLQHRAQAVACVSEGVLQFARQVLRVPSDKLALTGNAVDVAAFQNVKPTLRRELSLPDVVPLVVSVGRLDEQKGTSYLVEAAAILARRGVRAAFAIAGSGPLLDRLKHQAERLGIADRVHFLGWRADVANVLASGDLFVLASLWEGMPNVILEAMACGKPVVATRVAGSSELVIDGETGRLVPATDPASLAEAIDQMLGNRALLQAMGLGGLERVRRSFTAEQSVQATVELYRAAARPPTS